MGHCARKTHSREERAAGGGNAIPVIYAIEEPETSQHPDHQERIIPPSQDKVDRVAEINGRPNCQAFLSRKRTIENYIDIAAVGRISQDRIQIAANVDPDYGNVADAFANALKAGRAAHGHNLNFHPVDHDGSALPLAKCKKIITAYIMRNMTADEVLARGAFVDENGSNQNEILNWLSAIRAHI